MKKSVLIILIAVIGGFFSSCKKDSPKPNASFTATSTSLNDGKNPVVGEKITFKNNSTEATEYSWDFGDGETSEAENPTHIYEEGGDYTVTLEAKGSGGTSTETYDIEVLSVAGTWEGQMELDSDFYDFDFNLEYKNGTISGTIIDYEEYDISSFKISNNDVTVTFTERILYEGTTYVLNYKMTGEISDDYTEMSGTYTINNKSAGDWETSKTSDKSCKLKSKTVGDKSLKSIIEKINSLK